MFQGANRWRSQPIRNSSPNLRPLAGASSASGATSRDLAQSDEAGATQKRKGWVFLIALLAVAALVFLLVMLLHQPGDPQMTVISGTGVQSGDTGGGTINAGNTAAGPTDAAVADGDTGANSAAGTGAADAAAAANGSGNQGALRVYISGAVNTPGVIELATGDRLIDAINLCGGLSDDAAAEFVNLAALVEDGMHIHIPRLSEVAGQTPPLGTSNGLGSALLAGTSADAGTSTGTDSAAGAGSSSSTGSTASSTASPGLVNINSADEATLQTLPGIGPVTAQRIIAYRTANGPFQQTSDLKKVSGIGDARYADIQALVTCR